MRLKLIAVFCLILVLSGLALAQEGGGKPLPGEGETPTATPTMTSAASATATNPPVDSATATPTEFNATEEATNTETAVPTEAIETEESNTTDGAFPADMLASAGIEVEESELLLHETFDEDDVWELGDYETGTLSIDDGHYLVTVEQQGYFLWGQNEEEYSNAVIQVTTEQLSREDNNSYGLICRANPENNGDGYHIRITGEGDAMIFVYRNGRQRDGVTAENVDAINQGRDTNVITAVCIDNYVALFVNGIFVLDFGSDEYDEGVTGLAASNSVEDTETEVSFDDVYIWEVGSATVPDVELDSNPDENVDTTADLDPDQAAEEVTDALEQGDIAIELGDFIFGEDFSHEGDWYFNNGDMGVAVDENDGVYRFEGVGEDLFFWAFNSSEEEYEDVVIRVDANFVSGDDTEYGIMCRSDENADGYNFLIKSTGDYVISRWIGSDYEVLADGDSDAINTGEDSNTIYAVCVGEYLALYVNDELVDETDDDEYDAGITNFAVMPRNNDDVTVEFDNLYVWEAND